MTQSNPSFSALKRLNYFNGMFLTQELMQGEQTYMRHLSMYQNSALFTSGTVIGLNVSAKGRAISISSGLAIDGMGQLLVWPSEAQPVPVGSTISGTQYVSISYQATQSDQGNFLDEQPRISLGENKPSDPNLVIAELSVQAGDAGSVTVVNNDKTSPTLKNPDMASAATKPTENETTEPGPGEKPLAESPAPQSSPLAGAQTGAKTLPITVSGHRVKIKKTVSFPKAFTTEPRVMLTAQAQTGDDTIYVASASGVTKSEFTLLVTSLSSVDESVNQVQVNWMAWQE